MHMNQCSGKTKAEIADTAHKIELKTFGKSIGYRAKNESLWLMVAREVAS